MDHWLLLAIALGGCAMLLLVGPVLGSSWFRRREEKRRLGKELLFLCDLGEGSVGNYAVKLGIQIQASDREYVPARLYGMFPPREFGIFICYLLYPLRFERYGQERQKAIAKRIAEQLLDLPEPYRREFLQVPRAYLRIQPVSEALRFALISVTSDRHREQPEAAGTLPAA